MQDGVAKVKCLLILGVFGVSKDSQECNMKSYPTKLKRYLNGLTPAERQEKTELFEKILEKAQTLGLQSPRFWAMRQIVSGLNAGQIEQKIKQRIKGNIRHGDLHHPSQ